MRVLFSFFLTAILFWACNSDPRNNLQKHGLFGTPFTSSGKIIDAKDLSDADSLLLNYTFIQGTVAKVCQGEGCWLSLDAPDGPLRVEAKDKSFILPRKIEGSKVIAHGRFVKKENKKGRPYYFEAEGLIIE